MKKEAKNSVGEEYILDYNKKITYMVNSIKNHEQLYLIYQFVKTGYDEEMVGIKTPHH